MIRLIPLLLWMVLMMGCTKSSEKTSSTHKGPVSSKGDKVIPPEITITSSRTDVIYSYRSGNRFITAPSIEEIPSDARAQVVVTDLSLSPAQRQAGRYIYIADLRKPRANGDFPVSIASRYGLEAKLSKTHSSSASAQVQTDQVIVYSTSWCGVCKKAMRLLNSWGVSYVEKDIEGSRKAKNELASKSQAAGIQPGGVPVIDVQGTLLQGLDEATLKSVLQSKGLL